MHPCRKTPSCLIGACGSVIAAAAVLIGPSALAQAPAPAAAVPQVGGGGDNCPNYPCKASRVQTRATHAADHINVRFNTGVMARERDGALSDLNSGDLAAPDVQAVLQKYAALGCKWMRVHNAVTEQLLDQLHAKAEKNLGKAIANLNQDFFLYFPEPLDIAGLDAAINDFNALAIVEMAEPALMPYALPTPPDYKAEQNYHFPSDAGGVNTFGLRLFPGGSGEAARVCDLEYSWNLAHQDLPAITMLGGPGVDPFNSTNHGTAVLGELFGRENGWGVTGGVPNSPAFVAPTNFSTGFNIAQAITTTLATFTDGDVILIEQQIGGPNDANNGSQVGLVPVEWNVGIYNTIVTAIGNNVHVVEAAGNGWQNLNAAEYGTGNGGHHPFAGGINSGAIIVGAGCSPGGTSTERSRLDFSNYGTRVNVQGWGENVVTLGYGTRYSAEGMNLLYANSFGGTSSASPIVTSAVAVYNSIMETYLGTPETPSFTRLFMDLTGLPQTGGTFPASQRIGPRPDALAAINATMLAAAANNTCASATNLVSPGYGWTTGRVVGGSVDGTASCVSGSNTVDVWYRFVAPAYAGKLWVSTCGTHDFGHLDTGMDTVLSAFSGCGGTEMGCSDDDFTNPTGCGSNNGIIRDSALVIPLGAGAQTLIRVANYPSSPRSAFAIGWIYIPANDTCASAVDVSAGGTFVGTLVNAQADGSATCGSSNGNGDIWYRFNACASGTLTLTTCGTHDFIRPDIGVDSVLATFNGCGGTQIDCNDDAPNSNCGTLDTGVIRDSFLQHPVSAGQSILIRVSKWSTSVVGAVRLNVAFTPSNDCAFNPNIAVTGANPFCNAGTSGGYVTESACGGNPNAYNNVFYSYIAPFAGQLTLSTCGATYDTKMVLYLGSGCPILPNGAFLCNDDTPGCAAGGNPNYGSRITTTATAGQAFKIRVGAYATTGYGTGVLNIALVGNSGACCRGSSCAVLDQADCVAGPFGGASWVAGAACNTPGNSLTPCCKADFNHSGGVSVQDIFDFLAAYFGNNLTADFNASGAVSVQDIFDFLAGYFAGCGV